MIDIFLRFQNIDTAEQLLKLIGAMYIENDTKHLINATHQYALWEVGEISGIDGYHINIRIVDPNFDISSLEPYRVYPKNPVCIWA